GAGAWRVAARRGDRLRPPLGAPRLHGGRRAPARPRGRPASRGPGPRRDMARAAGRAPAGVRGPRRTPSRFQLESVLTFRPSRGGNPASRKRSMMSELFGVIWGLPKSIWQIRVHGLKGAVALPTWL